MHVLIQRVKQAQVDVADQTIGKIQHGLLVFVGFESGDQQQQVDTMLHKLLRYRVFADDQGKMNWNVQQVKGSLLLVSQFTLAANTQKGLRPSFSSAAKPDDAERLYQYMINQAKQSDVAIETGSFGADMQVSLVNDGPVTFHFHI